MGQFRRFSVPSFVARISGAVMAIVAGVAAEGQAQSISPSAAPVEWVRYAEAITATISGWLEEDSDAATRLRIHLDATRLAADRATPPVVLKLWIEPDGQVSRIEFTPFADEQANVDLRAAIVGRRLLTSPPTDMRLPLRLAVRLEPHSTDVAPGNTT